MFRQSLSLFIKKQKETFPPRDPSHTVEWFLKTIRRECDQYIDKFKDWDHLFTVTSKEMEELGIHARARKKILMWTERYRQGFDPFYIYPSQKLVRKHIQLRRMAEAKAAENQNKQGNQ
ncbi:hypothetical protein ROZALSC1DRAFT_28608 [Rozella allomycis CSF55]|uniref:Small ribosomal subunit protein mS41 n=1 Tax=Rozella allomycis (strain CSF55) TaxID=988480 RepID=A0A075ANV2_ROZAC|nr:hypothetical protein O9G_000106 [Rozella allomycis CSF55]RKP19836.1 hypothetical protein ROZALSC1DRAFT_28608 [Rozella allomycis CSF55]|eukprot:EPZ31627.1 hypothetical protein O9G_000106 [Rozella allomycis CSF55]